MSTAKMTWPASSKLRRGSCGCKKRPGHCFIYLLTALLSASSDGYPTLRNGISVPLPEASVGRHIEFSEKQPNTVGEAILKAFLGMESDPLAGEKIVVPDGVDHLYPGAHGIILRREA